MKRKIIDYVFYAVAIVCAIYVAKHSNHKVNYAFITYIFVTSIIYRDEVKRYFLDPQNLKKEKFDMVCQNFVELAQEIKKTSY